MLKRLSPIILAILFMCCSNALVAQLDNPVTWSFSQNQVSETEVDLIFSAEIESGWTVYSQFLGEDATPWPTTLEYETKDGVTLVGKSIESGEKKEGIDPIFEEHVTKFLSGKPYVITQRISVSGDWKAAGYLEFMTCDSIKCLPPTPVDFSFMGSVSASPTTNTAIVNGQTDAASTKQIPSPEQAQEKTISKDAQPSKTIAATPIQNTESNVQNADIENPVSWSYNIEKTGEPNVYDLQLTADIADGWQIYSYYIKDGGPIPTYLDFETTEGFEQVGEPIEKGKKKDEFDKIFDMDVIKFLSGAPYTYNQKFRTTGDIKKGNIYLSYMSCDDSKCIPFDEEIVLDLENLGVFKASSDVANANLSAVNGNEIDQVRPRIVETYKEPIGDCGKGDNQESDSLLSVFIIGFIGGLFAILLPCIFPMIPITVSYFMKDTKRKGWVNGLIYGLSIITIFVGIGLLITALLGPEALNRLSTNWIANTIFFLIFVAFAISFFGYFEITLPSSWSTKSDAVADKGGLLGTFFMAATLAIVSFSCTGPIIGTALVQVASQGSYWGPASVMLGFSTALALPFGFFAAFPTWLNSLPRSGSWMTSLKVILGFLELALALKFLSVADMTEHWGFLKYELFLFLWILIFLAMAAYLMGWIRFPHDSKLKKRSLPRLGFAALATVTAIYLALGFRVDPVTDTYDTPGLTSGIAPPATYNFFLDAPSISPELKAKYPSISKCANNITCFKDYFEGLAFAKETNRPVLLDYTGYGCVNCRKTEEHIWVNDNVRNLLNDEFVLISLYVDDREKLDEELVSKSRQVRIRNVGNKWSDFQIVNFEQNSQPLYVLMTPDEQVMASPRGYREGIQQYVDYLECGLDVFGKK